MTDTTTPTTDTPATDTPTTDTPAQSRHIALESVDNFRDMGGYRARDGRTVRWGRLFRSGHLGNMSEACGTEMLARDIETVIDFRSDAEKEHRPVQWPCTWRPRYHAVPIGGNAAAWVRAMITSIAEADFPADEARAQFLTAFKTIPIQNAPGLKTLFDILLDDHQGNAALFHCTAGKDRTGIAAALVLRALDIDEEQVLEDFLMTNQVVDLETASTALAERIGARAGKRVTAEAVRPLVGVEADFLRAADTAIADRFGSLSTYMQTALGLTPDRQDRLKDMYLAG